jgi:translation elongation factor EF-1alpha
MAEKSIGRVVKYFSKAGAAAIELERENLKVGDTVVFRGHTTDFTQTIDSMQVDNQPIEEAKPGDSIGIKVSERVRPHDEVLKVIPD